MTFKKCKVVMLPTNEKELIFVKNFADNDWILRYATGELDDNKRVITYINQKTSGDTASWNYHASAHGVKLPD